MPKAAYIYDSLPGEEVVVRGFLEANDRAVLAVPKVGSPHFITEADVDQLSSQGSAGDYANFYKKGWTHVLRIDGISVQPSYTAGGSSWYVIISSGTEAWRSSDVLARFSGKEVEILGKWDSFVVPDLSPVIAVTQFQPRSIRVAE